MNASTELNTGRRNAVRLEFFHERPARDFLNLCQRLGIFARIRRRDDGSLLVAALTRSGDEKSELFRACAARRPPGKMRSW